MTPWRRRKFRRLQAETEARRRAWLVAGGGMGPEREALIDALFNEGTFRFRKLLNRLGDR